MIAPNPQCIKCGHLQGNTCALMSKDIIDPKETYCMHYTESPYICELCGKHLFTEAVCYTTGIKEPYHMVCIQCYSTMYTCNSCSEAHTCRFENDQTVPEQPYVMQQIRQGNSIMQTQVKNPRRINLTCKAGCPCFVNNECIREAGGSCDKYKCPVPNW